MTCKQMGGPCDTAIHGATSMEMINNGTAHVNEMAEKDEGHKAAQEMMKQAQTNPELAKQWGDKFEKDFAALPDDQ